MYLPEKVILKQYPFREYVDTNSMNSRLGDILNVPFRELTERETQGKLSKVENRKKITILKL